MPALKKASYSVKYQSMTWRKVEFPQFLLKSQKQQHVSSLSTLQSIILRPSLHDGTLNLLRIQMFNVKTFSSREHKTTKQKQPGINIIKVWSIAV